MKDVLICLMAVICIVFICYNIFSVLICRKKLKSADKIYKTENNEYTAEICRSVCYVVMFGFVMMSYDNSVSTLIFLTSLVVAVAVDIVLTQFFGKSNCILADGVCFGLRFIAKDKCRYVINKERHNIEIYFIGKGKSKKPVKFFFDKIDDDLENFMGQHYNKQRIN